MRQSLIETLLLSLAGGALGLGIAFAATRVLIGFVSQGNAYIAMDPTPDSTVMLFTLGLLCSREFSLDLPRLSPQRTSEQQAT